MQLKVPHILEKIQITEDQERSVRYMQLHLERGSNLWTEEKAVAALCLAARYLNKAEINKKHACEMLRQCMSLGSGGGDKIQ